MQYILIMFFSLPNSSQILSSFLCIQLCSLPSPLSKTNKPNENKNKNKQAKDIMTKKCQNDMNEKNSQK